VGTRLKRRGGGTCGMYKTCAIRRRHARHSLDSSRGSLLRQRRQVASCRPSVCRPVSSCIHNIELSYVYLTSCALGRTFRGSISYAKRPREPENFSSPFVTTYYTFWAAKRCIAPPAILSESGQNLPLLRRNATNSRQKRQLSDGLSHNSYFLATLDPMSARLEVGND